MDSFGQHIFVVCTILLVMCKGDVYNKIYLSLRDAMSEGYQSVIIEQAIATKRKRDTIVQKNLPYPCKKCGEDKFPDDFVIQYIDNPIAGKYRYLYECKQCKKDRIYEKRWGVKESIEWACAIIFQQLQNVAKQRRLPFHLKESDIHAMREKQKGKCYYTGYEMTYECISSKLWTLNEKTTYQLSCDRLDSEGGYEKDNCVLCCMIINKMKNSLTEEGFYKICNDIVRNRRS